ncbi:MAG: helix-turn-helix domain-containing protein [Clostridia bacterium]|nr:helix-turn-helix domain-containing protein [Clostridia bacterium]
MTLQQIADTSGIPKRTVDQIFSGKTTNPRVDTMQAIEQALGLSKPDWTDDEKALGVGRYATYLSEEETEWLELRSEVLRIKGEDYLKTLTEMIEAVIKHK